MRKTHNHRLDLPPLELECMKALWCLGEGTIDALRGQMLPARPLAYTTVMTIMERLALKGVVKREKRGRWRLYVPLVSDSEVCERAVKRLVDGFFQGSRESLRRYLANGGKPQTTEAVRAPDSKSPLQEPNIRPEPRPDGTAIDTELL